MNKNHRLIEIMTGIRVDINEIRTNTSYHARRASHLAQIAAIKSCIRRLPSRVKQRHHRRVAGSSAHNLCVKSHTPFVKELRLFGRRAGVPRCEEIARSITSSRLLLTASRGGMTTGGPRTVARRDAAIAAAYLTHTSFLRRSHRGDIWLISSPHHDASLCACILPHKIYPSGGRGMKWHQQMA